MTETVGTYCAPEPIVRYKAAIELVPENGRKRKLHVSIGARNFREARKEALKSAINFFVHSNSYPESERESQIAATLVSGSTQRMNDTRKKGLMHRC